MDTEPLPQGRAKIEDGPGPSLRIVLPARRQAFVVLFMCVWMGMWFFGERSAIQQVRAASDPMADGFIVFWLASWTLGGAFALFAILWMTLGREVLELRSDVLLHSRAILGIGKSRACDLAKIRDLRLGAATPRIVGFAKPADSTTAVLGLSGGPIVFDYGAKTVRCGAALDEAEAKQLIARMIQREGRLAAKGAA